jgi:hypothetical protein
MSTKPHEIFITEEDRWNWDKYIQRWDQSELGGSEKKRTNDSLRYLRSTLGEGYLRRADRRRNPMLFWHFTDWSNGARLSMIRFAEALKALEASKDFKAILKRVRRPKSLEELLEGRSVVDVAYKFFRAGFSIEEFEPHVRVPDYLGKAGSKYPDMKIVNRDTGEEIIVEVSRQKPGDDENLNSNTYDVIWYVLIHESMHCDPEALKNVTCPRHILPFAKIHRGIKEDELKGVVQKIRELVQKVRTSGEFDKLIIPDTIEVGIASYDDHHRAREWAASRGIREDYQIDPPVIDTDEIARAKRKLSEKVYEQIPEDTPGIVVLEASENLILFRYPVELLAAALGEEAQKHPKLLCAVMFHTFNDGKDEKLSVNLGPHTYNRVARSDGAAERSLILRNMACKHNVSAETLEKVGEAFGVD